MPMTNDETVYLGSPDNPKTAAVVCYITLIGWLIAYFALYQNKKNPLAAYHLRQTLLLYILLLVINILGYWAIWGFVIAVDTIWFILWVWGFYYAVNEQEKPVPIIGALSQTLFHNL
jgi:uncharacterized membrane protein